MEYSITSEPVNRPLLSPKYSSVLWNICHDGVFQTVRDQVPDTDYAWSKCHCGYYRRIRLWKAEKYQGILPFYLPIQIKINLN